MKPTQEEFFEEEIIVATDKTLNIFEIRFLLKNINF